MIVSVIDLLVFSIGNVIASETEEEIFRILGTFRFKHQILVRQSGQAVPVGL